MRAPTAHARAALTLTAVRHNPPLKAFYDKLVAAGKRKKVVVGA